MSTKVRVGLIGLGWPGREHLKGYLATPAAEVAALCDLDEPLLQRVAGEHGIRRTYADYRQMLAREKLDAVSVCVPNHRHAELTIEALRAGAHVLCEKPPAMNVAEAEAMARAARESGRLLMYALVMRFHPETRFLKDLIVAGELGEIYIGKAGYTRRRGIPLGRDNWFVDKSRAGGGAMIDIGVHALDCIWYLMGTPSPVSVSGSAYRKFARCVPEGVRYDVDDAALALIKFANGATLFLEASWAWNLPGGTTKQVAGTKGGAQLDPLRIHTEKNGVVLDAALGDKSIPAGYGGAPANPFAAEVAHFLAALAGAVPPVATAEEGVALMQMLTGVYESAETGREIRF